MKRIVIYLTTQDAAFENYPQMEVQRILIDFAQRFPSMDISRPRGKKSWKHKLYDLNGNAVGNVTVS